MGAFENAVREEESFESLLVLYKESLDGERILKSLNAELREKLEEVAARRLELAVSFSELGDELRAERDRWQLEASHLMHVNLEQGTALATAIHRAETAEKLAVWAARNGAMFHEDSLGWVKAGSGFEIGSLPCDGTDAGILSAVRQAREGE